MVEAELVVEQLSEPLNLVLPRLEVVPRKTEEGRRNLEDEDVRDSVVLGEGRDKGPEETVGQLGRGGRERDETRFTWTSMTPSTDRRIPNCSYCR